jgi:hypothetical protein
MRYSKSDMAQMIKRHQTFLGQPPLMTVSSLFKRALHSFSNNVMKSSRGIDLAR